MTNMATNNAVLRNGSVVVVLNPEHANILSGAGLSRQDVAVCLFELAHHPRAELERLASAFTGRAGDHELVSCFETPEQILIMMAGGSGLYSMVMPSWCAGAHRNCAVSVQVVIDPSCEVPGAG